MFFKLVFIKRISFIFMKHTMYTSFIFLYVCMYIHIFNIKLNCNSIYRLVRLKQYVGLQMAYNKPTTIYLKWKMK